jgi:glutathione S-transferase
MDVKLYMVPGSNSVYTGRLMLEHKGIDYTTVRLPPAAHAFIMLALGFPTMGVPAIKVDGRRAQGTRAISRALDELVPRRPLFPADPARRGAVERAERWGEDLQNATRRIFYCAARRDRGAFTSLMAAERGFAMRAAPRRPRAAARAPRPDRRPHAMRIGGASTPAGVGSVSAKMARWGP